MKLKGAALAALMTTGCATPSPIVLRQPVDCPVCPEPTPALVIPSACLEGPALEPGDPPLPAPPDPGADALTRETWRRGVLESQFVTLRQRNAINEGRLLACREGLEAAVDD